MKYLLNIFDIDGTLIDSHVAIGMALQKVLSDFKLPVMDIRSIKNLIGLPLEETFKALGITDRDYRKALMLYRFYYYPNIPLYQKIYPGIPETLRSLKKMLLLSAVTNKGAMGAELSLQHAGLKGIFDIVLTEDNMKKLKPDPWAFGRIMKFYKSQGKFLEKEDVLMVGDSLSDLEFAANSGIKSAFASWGFGTLKSDAKPDYILAKPSDLEGIDDINETVNVEITTELDLHTFAPGETKVLVMDYIKSAREKGFKSVRIIHGKGKGIQRQIVRNVLGELNFVKNFYDAPEFIGGRGATIAELELKKD